MRRLTSYRFALATHMLVAFIVIAWSMWGAFSFWGEVFGSPWIALGLTALVEMSALMMFVVHLAGHRTMMTNIRHALPFVSAVVALKPLHDAASANVADALAWTISGAVALTLFAFSWMIWRSIEQLVASRDDIERRRSEHRSRRIEIALSEEMAEIDAMHRRLKLYADVVAHTQRLLADAREEITHRRLPEQPPFVDCPVCGAQTPVPEGKNAQYFRMALARYGCPSCRAEHPSNNGVAPRDASRVDR